MLLAQVAMFGLAAGHGGSYTALALPATASRQLLVPAVIALFFAYVAATFVAGLATLAVAAGALALVHPTYALFVADPARRLRGRPAGPRPDGARGGSAGARRRRRSRRTWSRSGCGRSPARRLRSNPSGGRAHPGAPALPGPARRLLGRQLPPRAGGLRARRGRSPSLALLRRAARRRSPRAGAGPRSCSAASSPCSRSCSWPTLFTHFADAVSISQARRAAGFVPFPFAVAGGAAVLARLLSIGALPVRARRRASRSSSPTRATSATRSTRAGPRWRPGSRSSAAPRARRVGAFLPRRLDRARPRGPDRRGDRRARGPAGRAARLHPLGRAPDVARGADPRARPGAARPCAGEGGRVLRRRDELRRSPRFAPVYVADAPARPRRRHEGEPAVRAARRRPRVLPHREPRDPAPLRRDLARRRPQPLEAAARPAAGRTRTRGTSSTVSRS